MYFGRRGTRAANWKSSHLLLFRFTVVVVIVFAVVVLFSLRISSLSLSCDTHAIFVLRRKPHKRGAAGLLDACVRARYPGAAMEADRERYGGR